MLANLIVVEHVKLLKRRLLWVEVGLLTAVVLIQEFGQRAFSARSPGPRSGIEITPEMLERAYVSVTWPSAFPAIINSVGQLGWLLVVVLFGAVVAQEYNWRTLHLWVARGSPRGSLILAKALAMPLPSLIVVVVPLVAGATLTALFTLQLTGTLSLAQVDALRLAQSILLTAYGLLPYGAVALLLAVASRSTIAPIGGGVAFVIAEMVMLNAGTPVSPYMPSGLATALMTLSASIVRAAVSPATAQLAQSRVTLLDPTSAALGIALWTVGAIGLAYWIHRRQDLAD